MTLPIFWRLMLSHIGILVLSGAACLYSIVQLGSLGGAAREALHTSQRMIAYQEALIDAFLSQVRYGGKYLITHTPARHEQFRQFKKDFVNYLDLLKQLDQAGSVAASLSRIERFHHQYHELFGREAALIRARQIYAQTRYQQERDRIVDAVLSELDSLKAQTRAKLQEELESIDRGARTARKIATATTLLVLLLGALFSWKVSGSIEISSGEPPDSASFSKLIRWTRESGAAIVTRRWAQRIVSRLANWSTFAASLIGTWSRRF